MNTRKMCRFYYGSTVEERECRKCSNNTPCPDNVNAKCEIVPRKSKPKYKRVKALANITGNVIQALNEKCGPYKWFYDTPCEILIEAKYIKGRK